MSSGPLVFGECNKLWRRIVKRIIASAVLAAVVMVAVFFGSVEFGVEAGAAVAVAAIAAFVVGFILGFDPGFASGFTALAAGCIVGATAYALPSLTVIGVGLAVAAGFGVADIAHKEGVTIAKAMLVYLIEAVCMMIPITLHLLYGGR